MADFLPFLSTVYLNAGQMSNVTIVLLYAAMLVIVTSMISLRTNDPDPMLAGRNMPWWLVAGSIIGTTVSSIAFLAYPQKGYALDLYFLFGNFLGKISGIVLVLIFFVSFLRKTRNASIYTLLGDRFGKWSAIYASIAFIAYSTIRMGVITCLVSQALHLVCGVDVLPIMILTGAIVIFYTYMSGIEGVIWTDFFQTITLVAAGLFSAYFLIDKLSAVKTIEAWDAVKNTLTSEANKSTYHDGFLYFVTFLFCMSTDVCFYGANQGIGQRYIVARSNKHAKWGLAIGGLIIPFVVALFFFLGVLLYLFHQENPIAGFAFTDNIESAFAHFIAHHFPDGLKGLAIVGILAAAMSTIDTGINSSSTVLICNLYEPYAKASATRQSLLTMQILRASSALFGATGILAAYLIYLNGQSALELFWKGIGVTESGVFALFILMRLSKKAGPKSAILAFSIGSVFACWMTFTAGQAYSLASPFHYMLTLPISTTVAVLVGLAASRLFNEDIVTAAHQADIPSEKLRKELARRRNRTKKNIFSDSLRPKPFYRLYAFMAAIGGCLLWVEGPRIGLLGADYFFIKASIAVLSLVALLPFVLKNIYNRPYTLFYLTLLGIGLPFLGAIGLFAHPAELLFGYFYLITLIILGTMIGWTMLGLVTMLATAAAAQVAVEVYPLAGVPANWALLAMGALAIFTYFAMDAARENMVTERTLGRVHGIIEKIYSKVFSVSIDLIAAKRALNFKDIDQLAKTAGEARLMLSAMLGATDINPEETNLELSVKETIAHVLSRVSKKAFNSVTIEGEDFNILGNRDIFESILSHILENAFYYVERGEATAVVIELDADRKTIAIRNNGPTIAPEHRPYIFDLGYSCDKESLGIGLTYCKRMLEGMRSGIRLISKPNDPWVVFKLYFPKYATLPPEARMYKIKDDDINEKPNESE